MINWLFLGGYKKTVGIFRDKLMKVNFRANKDHTYKICSYK